MAPLTEVQIVPARLCFKTYSGILQGAVMGRIRGLVVSPTAAPDKTVLTEELLALSASDPLVNTLVADLNALSGSIEVSTEPEPLVETLKRMAEWAFIKKFVDRQMGRQSDISLQEYAEKSVTSKQLFGIMYSQGKEFKPIANRLLQSLKSGENVWGKNYFRQTFEQDCKKNGVSFKRIIQDAKAVRPMLGPDFDVQPLFDVTAMAIPYPKRGKLLGFMLMSLDRSLSSDPRRLEVYDDKYRVSYDATFFANLEKDQNILADALISVLIAHQWGGILNQLPLRSRWLPLYDPLKG